MKYVSYANTARMFVFLLTSLLVIHCNAANGKLPKLKDYVPLNKIPSKLVKYFIAIEDPEFYQKNRYTQKNTSKIVQASRTRIRYLRFRHSSITTKVARYLTYGGRYPSYEGILKLAALVEKNNSKSKILEFYLNKVTLGFWVKGSERGAHDGVKVAARVYFGKDLKSLSVAECALIVGLAKSPARNDPFKYPDRAIRRRNFVLGILHQKKLISEKNLSGFNKDAARFGHSKVNFGFY